LNALDAPVPDAPMIDAPMVDAPGPGAPGYSSDPRPARGRNRWRMLLVLVLLAVAAGLLFWWLHASGGAASRNAGPKTPPQAVGVAAASVGDVPIVDSGLGTVTPLATITVQTQISGLLQSIGFTEGQIVKKGDFLAQIDPRPYEALLAQARGQLARDEGVLAQAQADEKRYARLNAQDSIARQQAEDQHFLVQQDQGTVAADQGMIQTQLVNLAFCHITSPVAGRVGLRQVDAGNYVTPAETNGLVVVTQLQPISVIFTLPEDDLPQIMQRLGLGVTLPVTVFDRNNTIQLGTGGLQAVDTQIDTTTGTVKLRALFANADNALFPNQFVNAQLLVDTHAKVVTVPNAALQSGAPGNFVYVVNGDNTVSVRVIKLGAATASVTEITSGLKAGERVVIDGADRLREGARVIIPTAAAPGAAAPAAHHRHHHQE
jgi:multidrug efflux system membrane fusion protein